MKKVIISFMLLGVDCAWAKAFSLPLHAVSLATEWDHLRSLEMPIKVSIQMLI
jgi:hypothetical protein